MTNSPPVREGQQTCEVFLHDPYQFGPCGEPIALVEGKWEHLELYGACATCGELRTKHGRLGWEHCPNLPPGPFGHPDRVYRSPVITLAHPAQGED